MSKVIKSALELIGNTPLLQADRYACLLYTSPSPRDA